MSALPKRQAETLTVIERYGSMPVRLVPCTPPRASIGTRRLDVRAVLGLLDRGYLARPSIERRDLWLTSDGRAAAVALSG